MVGHRRWRQLFISAASLLAGMAGMAHAAHEPPDDEEDASTPVAETPAPASGAAEIPPGPVRRVAASFDFEEADNPYPVPRYWVRAQDSERTPRPGFPAFNGAEFDFTIAHSGTASVRLPTLGGSTAIRLGAGVIPVFPDADYAIHLWVRTADLAHARAFVRATMLDQASRPIPGADVRSAPLATQGAWTEVSLQLTGAPANAAYMQLDLELLQSRQFGAGLAGQLPPHDVSLEDVSGAAWFDDIVVHQLPRVELTTGAPANVVLLPERPIVHILVRDFVGERLHGDLVVSDVDGEIIEQVRMPLATSGFPQEWTPQLPRLGWYRVTLGVLGENTDGEPYVVGRTEMSFLWMPGSGMLAARLADSPRVDRDRFGIIADRIEPALSGSLAGVCRTTGTGFVSIPLWPDDITREEIASSIVEYGSLIDSLSHAGQRITVCVPSIPGALMREFQIATDDPLALADVDSAAWMPYLLPVLDRYGQRLTRWQAGRTGTTGAFWRGDVGGAAERFLKHVAALVPGPRLSIPWGAEFAVPDGLLGSESVSSLVVTYPSAFASESTGDVVRELVSHTATAGGELGAEIVIVPELLPVDVFGDRASVTEVARRYVEFWAARTDPALAAKPLSIAVSHPWENGGGRRPQLMPAAALGAVRTLVDHLSERRVVGEYQIAGGVKCYILADLQTPRGSLVRGALVAWNESAAPGQAVLKRFLGDGVIEAVDIFGNRTPVERSSETGGPHVVQLSDTPMFIEGVDPMLAVFCMQVKVEPTFLPAVQTEHELALVLTNPWSQAISGKLQIVPPGDAMGTTDAAVNPEAAGGGGRAARTGRWSVSPDGIIPFSLGAGQTKRIPWTAAFPYFEETGEKAFSVVVRLATDRELPPIVLARALRVGLQDLALEPDVQLGPRLDGPDIIIIATITNRGQRSRMLKLEAVAPGIPTQQTIISDLPGGEVVIKRIVMKNMAAQLAGKRIHLSLADSEEQERLNVSVRVP